MKEKERVVILGAGAHSRVVIDILEQMEKYEIVGLLDKKEDTVLGYKVIGTDDRLEELFDSGIKLAFIAIGNNHVRRELYNTIKTIGYELINAISPRAFISQYVSIGEGVAVMPGATVNAGTRIGNGVIINTNASVDHDCVIGNFCHVAPGATVCGSCTIGMNSFLGAGCNVIDKKNIGQDSIIGAGAVVLNDIEDRVVAAGVPARRIRNLTVSSF